jgi:hypothetical protein
MGRKGVSKRKPKKNRPFSSTDIGGSSNTRSGERPLVQSQVRDHRASLNTGAMNLPGGSKKKGMEG